MERYKYGFAHFAGAGIAAIFIAAWMALPVCANEVTGLVVNDKIKENQQAITKAEEEKNKLAAGKQGIEQILASLETVKGDLEEYVTQLDANLNDMNEKLKELDAKLVEKEQSIKITQTALEKAKKEEAVQYASMKKRIQFMYERGDTTYLEMMFSADGIRDFLNKNEFITKISQYDRRMLVNLIATKEEISAAEKELLAEKKELEEVQKEIKTEQASVESLMDAKEEEINRYDSDISNKEKLIKEYEAEIASQNATIKSLEAAIAEERKRLLAENGSARVYDGGQFSFPCPGYTRVSDEYGTRVHPILGIEQFHNGVDLAAPSGTAICAAYDGTVIAAAYSSTMGNYIMIDHGDGLFTIYMHASSLSVSNGESVSKGQNIAAVGSTGRSTGPHLHFSVRLNGSYVSPWGYLK